MECREVEQMIDAYLDRELPAGEARAVESHLADCAACRDRHGPVVDMLTVPEPARVPDGLRDRIVTAVSDHGASHIAPEPRVGGSRWFWVPRVAGVAAAVALFVLGWAVSGIWKRPSPPVVVIPTVPEARSAPVEMTPWAVTCWAQNAATGVPIHPLLWAAQMTAMDVVMRRPLATTPVVRVTRRATTRQAPEDEVFPMPEAQFLQPIPRLLGVM